MVTEMHAMPTIAQVEPSIVRPAIWAMPLNNVPVRPPR